MILPSVDLYHFKPTQASEIHQGLDKQVDALLGAYKRRKGYLKQFERQAECIQNMMEEQTELAPSALRSALAQVQTEFANHKKIPDSSLNHAISLLARATQQLLGLRPHKVQFIAILALQKGYALEMDTGEGKTLVVGLAAILFAWQKHPCHVLTVNDYLAERDMRFIQPLAQFCGLSCAAIVAEQTPTERRLLYAFDLVYTTTHELLADFLRDRIQLKGSKSLTHHVLKQSASQRQGVLTTRGIHSVIVDEVDSILIDQAVSPLIISAPSENPLLIQAVKTAQQLAQSLENNLHYRTYEQHKVIQLNSAGLTKLAELASQLPGFWQKKSRTQELIQQSLSAREFFIKDKHYVVEEDKVIIVDEFSGRKMPSRSWSLGLHQAVEAKEQVTITAPNETLDKLSLQHFFRLFDRVGGVSGTVYEAANELWHIYRLPVLKVPRHNPCRRIIEKTRLFKDKPDKWQYLLELAQHKKQKGQPLLIGARTIEDSESIALQLQQAKIDYQLLNARHSESEAEIIAKAGRLGNITIATNMAGRGTDIELGEGSAASGGLCVIVTERHNSARIDRQLIGRSARQADIGSCQSLLSLDDEILRHNLAPGLRRFLQVFLHWPFIPALALLAFSYAQKKAEKKAYQQRQQVLKSDLALKQSLSFSGD